MNKEEIKNKLAQFQSVTPEADELGQISKENLIPWETTKKQLNNKIEKFILRLPGSLGSEIREQAEQEGVSLNQYILAATAFYQGYKKGISDNK